MRVVGIDPGIHSGAAIVHITEGEAPRLLDAIDLPVVGVGAKERINVLALRDWIRAYQPDHVAIERAQAMPRQGASSGFKYGRAVGALEAAIICLEIPVTFVEPAVWKRKHRLRGKDKEGARQIALQLFPGAHHLFARRKDHGRAEAALIALTGYVQRD